jgi:hypothetical protein
MTNVSGQFKKIIFANWCFVGVIVFFILHGYVQFIHEVPFSALLALFIKLLIEAVLLFFISRLLLGTTQKANLFTALAFVITLYFGVFQDFIVQFRPVASITRLRYYIPLTIVMIVILFVWIKRTRRSLNKAVLFLNTLLLIYIFIDTARLIVYRVNSPMRGSGQLARYNLKTCDTCHKPSVYLILLDSYWGSPALKEYFHYDNTNFENFLREQDFLVLPQSHSNYVFTMYSMASLFSMQYLGKIGEPVLSNHYGFVTATRSLKFNPVTAYFSNLGYEVRNYSGFDMDGIPAGKSSGILPGKVQLLISQTMYYRVNKSLPVYLSKNDMVHREAASVETDMINGNEEFMQRLLNESKTDGDKPVFTYAHFFMPHAPFVLDSNGRRTNYTERRHRLPADSIDNMYFQYEVYTNKRMTRFITEFKKATRGNAVIIVMSDHGYQDARTNNAKLRFYNLNAVYLPEKNYGAWYNGMSNVNQFRVLFNTLYRQQMPLLPDSIITK